MVEICAPYRGWLLLQRVEIGVTPYPILCRPYGALFLYLTTAILHTVPFDPSALAVTTM